MGPQAIKQSGRQPARPVTIRGTTYPSALAAASALDVSPAAVRNARAAGRLETVGLGRGAGRPVMPVTIRGVTYASAREAARALGVAVCTVYRAIGEGRGDEVGRGRGCNPPRARSVVIAGRRFKSLSAASRALGCNPKYLSNLANSTPTKAQREALYARVMALSARPADGASECGT